MKALVMTPDFLALASFLVIMGLALYPLESPAYTMVFLS